MITKMISKEKQRGFIKDLEKIHINVFFKVGKGCKSYSYWLQHILEE